MSQNTNDRLQRARRLCADAGYLCEGLSTDFLEPSMRDAGVVMKRMTAMYAAYRFLHQGEPQENSPESQEIERETRGLLSRHGLADQLTDDEAEIFKYDRDESNSRFAFRFVFPVSIAACAWALGAEVESPLKAQWQISFRSLKEKIPASADEVPEYAALAVLRSDVDVLEMLDACRLAAATIRMHKDQERAANAGWAEPLAGSLLPEAFEFNADDMVVNEWLITLTWICQNHRDWESIEVQVLS